MKQLITIAAVAVIGLATLASAEPGKNKEGKTERPGKGQGAGAPHRLENLLPPKVVENLNLSAEQKAKYDALSAAFKKDLEAWEKANPNAKEELQKAREARDREAGRKLMEARKPVMEARKGYIDQLRATLNDEQKQKLDGHVQEMRERMAKRPGGPAKKDKPAAPVE